MREDESGVVGEVRRDVFLVDALLHLVGKEEGDDLRSLDCLRDRADRETGLFGRVPGRAVRPEPDHDVDAGLVQVQRVRVALAAEAEDGDLP